MRTAFIAPQPFSDIRATPMQNVRLTRILADAGHSVHVITYPFGTAPEYPGVTIHRCPRPANVRGVGIGFSAAKLLTDSSLLRFALSLAKEYDFDIIHGVEEGTFIGALIGRRTGAPVIYDMDSIMSHDASTGVLGKIPFAVPFLRWAERWAVRNSSIVMTIAPPMADYVRSIDPAKEVVVVPDIPLPSPPLGPEVGRIRAEMPFLAEEGGKIILYTGSLAKYQGMDLLMQAMSKVVECEPGAILVVVGGDQEEIRVLEKMETPQMMDHVHFLGKKPPEEIPHILGVADVLVSPRRGGVNPPAKIYTYMQSGRPIVATDVPAHSSILAPKEGTLVEPSPDGIADGILWALSQPAEAMKKAAQAKAAVSHLTPESQARQVLEVYDRLSAGKSTARRIAA